MSVGPVSRLGAGREFDLIRRILADYAAGAATAGAAPAEPGASTVPGVRVGPGDDCAVLDNGIVVSVDMSVEGVHFQRAWLTDAEIGYRAAMAALSDLAAMAAAPVGMLVSIAAGDAAGEDAATVMRGAAAAARTIGAPLLGGDVTRSPGPLVVDVVAIGHAEQPVLRSGARPGDALFLTGRLGGAGAAVAAWRAGTQPGEAARAAFASPRARTAEARWLADRGSVHALIDLSDGIAGDAQHIAAASGVRLVIDGHALPLHPALREGADGPERAIGLALGAGEDYELLLAGDEAGIAACVEAFRDTFDVPLTRVGTVERGDGVWLRDAAGGVTSMPVTGYRHFEASP